MAWIKTISNIFLLIFLFNCSSTVEKTYSSPENIFNYANKEVAKKNYLFAREALEKIPIKFPHSKYVSLSRLKLADIDYLDGNHIEAAATFSLFVDLHPDHPKADYAQFMKAKALLKDSPKVIARDQQSARTAVLSARKLMIVYPKSKHYQEAKEVFFSARHKLAQKQIYIGEFYLKKGKNQAALNRFLTVKSKYADIIKSKGGEETLKKVSNYIEALQNNA